MEHNQQGLAKFPTKYMYSKHSQRKYTQHCKSKFPGFH